MSRFGGVEESEVDFAAVEPDLRIPFLGTFIPACAFESARIMFRLAAVSVIL